MMVKYTSIKEADKETKKIMTEIHNNVLKGSKTK